MKKRSRQAKFDLMTGFTGKKPEGDQGISGTGYYPRWTTLALPDSGRGTAIDDDQQPEGSGAPATVIPGAPLKTPMDADDVERPRLREGREAAKTTLQKVAYKIRLLDPHLSRRLLAASEELVYDDLSTAALPLAGDEENDVDKDQDKGHGTLSFFGTDAARPGQLTRESSRRQAGMDDLSDNENETPTGNESQIMKKLRKLGDVKEKDGFVYIKKRDNSKGRHKQHRFLMELADRYNMEIPDDFNQKGYFKVKCCTDSDPGPMSKLEYASRKKAAVTTMVGDVDLDATLKLVHEAYEGKIPAESAAQVFKHKAQQILQALQSGGKDHLTQYQGSDQVGKAASRKPRTARTEGDKPLHSKAQDPDDDGPVADGAGGFADRSKAPLQKSMTADDVDRPKIRENPEASRSLWSAFKNQVMRGETGGKWNEGQYRISPTDYGKTVEIQASVKDREGLVTPVGSLTLSVINDSGGGRYATLELNDDLIEKTTREITIDRKQASRLASWIFNEAKTVSQEALEYMGS